MAPLCSVNIYKPVETSRRCQCVVAIVVLVVESDVPGGDGRLFRLFRSSVTTTVRLHTYIHTHVNKSVYILVDLYISGHQNPSVLWVFTLIRHLSLNVLFCLLSC